MSTFNPNLDQGETYAELLERAANGYQIPTSRLRRAKRLEAAATAAATEAAEIESALQQAAAERAKHRAALDAKILPKLEEMRAELAELDQAADAARVTAREAIHAYRTAAEQAQNQFYAIRDTVQNNYGDPSIDSDGNPTDHTHVRLGVVTVNGELVTYHGMAEVMRRPEINRL